MKNISTTLLIVLLLFSCKDKAGSLSNEQRKEIESLKSDQDKNEYLVNLWYKDQSLRGGEEGEIIAKYGYNSKEHEEWTSQFKNNDNEVFQKLSYYLKNHNYPSNPSAYDELALNAFPIIIGHNHTYNSQERLLPYLYDAFKQGHCPLDDLVWVLGEMHESKYQGKRYEMKSNRYTTEDEFDELTTKLRLNLKR